MFGIKKLKERIERLEKNQEVDHTLVDKLRKFLIIQIDTMEYPYESK